MLDVPLMSFLSLHNLFTVLMLVTLELLPVSREELKNSAETTNQKIHKKLIELPKQEEQSLSAELMVGLILVELLVMESIRKMTLCLHKNK